MAQTICVGLVGPQGVGKSTFLKALLDNEFDLANDDGARRLTLALEFAHAKIYKCSSTGRTRSSCYRSCRDPEDMEDCGCDTPGHATERLSLSRRAGFVDCPGDLTFVPTILKGIMMTDGVLILSQPTDGFGVSPTLDALAAADLMGRSIVVVQVIKSPADHDQRKLDQHKKEIRTWIKELKISHGGQVPIVQISASTSLEGIGDICKRIIGMRRGEQSASSSSSGPSALMFISSSCVVDPVGEEDNAAAAAASAAGDTIMFVMIVGRVVQGLVSASDEVDVRPGIMARGDNGKTVYIPITLTVTSVAGGQDQLEDEGQAGDGLVALRASARIVNVAGNGRHLQQVQSVLGGEGGMAGHVLCHPAGCLLPAVYHALKVHVLVIPKIVDPYTERVYDPLPPVEQGQNLLLVIGTMSTYGIVKEVQVRKGKTSTIVVAGLTPPTWARHQERILICRQLEVSWRLIGTGTIVGGTALTMAGQPATLF